MACSQCANLLQVTLEASHAFHHLLDALENANIRNDIEEAFRQQAQLAAVTLSRDTSLTVLRDHQRTHVKKALRADNFQVAHVPASIRSESGV
jgi:hypothetical protein